MQNASNEASADHISAFSQQSSKMRRLWIDVARWVAVLPAAMLAAFFSLAALRLWLMFVMVDSTFRDVSAELFPNLTAGTLLIQVGVLTAPTKKREVAFTIFSLLLLGIGMGIGVNWAAFSSSWQQMTAIACLVIGSSIATWHTVARGADS